MMGQTSTKRCRWYLVPANNKPYARLAAFRILSDRLGKGVDLEPRPLDHKIAKAAARLFNSSDSVAGPSAFASSTTRHSRLKMGSALRSKWS